MGVDLSMKSIYRSIIVVTIVITQYLSSIRSFQFPSYPRNKYRLFSIDGSTDTRDYNTNLDIDNPNSKKPICIVGGGFGGLYTAIQLSKSLKQEYKHDREIILIDKKDSFVFLPLLYELAAGTASQYEVAPQYTSLLKNTTVRFLQGEAASVDLQQQKLYLLHPSSLSLQKSEVEFDKIVFAVGIQPRLDLIPGAKEHSVPFYRLEDAYTLKEKLKKLKEKNAKKVKIAVIGGGYSGIEVATTVSESLPTSEITLFDRNEKIMATSSEHNRRTAERALQHKSINIKLKHSIEKIDEGCLHLIDNNNDFKFVDDGYGLIILTSGTEQSEFVKDLNLDKDAYGRICVTKSLHVQNNLNIFALGDCCSVEGEAFPGTAQVAMQQSSAVTENLVTVIEEEMKRGSAVLEGDIRKSLKNFSYLNLGEMLTLGLTNGAVTGLNGIVGLNGPLASISRRLVYCVRMPTKTQSVKALINAGAVTAGNIWSRAFSSRSAKF